MKNRYPFIISAAIISLASGSAHADYLKLYSPRVEKGELAAEVDLNYSKDHRADQDKYLSQVVAAEYGVTDWWQTELGAEIEKDNGSNDQLTNLKFENVFVPWKPGENFVDTGFYLELEKARHSGDPNNVEAKILLEKNIHNFVNTANIGASHEFGNNASSGWSPSVALRTKYRYDKAFEPGIEYYADFGNTKDSLSYSEQDHKIGPVIQGQIGRVKYDTGVLFGVSAAAPDTTAKLNLEYEF